MFKSDRRRYLTADDKVVEEGDEAARTLLVGEGGEIPQDVADKYGLTTEEAPAEEAPTDEAPAEGEPADEKAEDAPPANKSVKKAPQNKAAK